MNPLGAGLVVAAGLFACGLGSLAARRSFAGLAIGITLVSLGLVAGSVTLFTQTGTSGSLGLVVATAAVVVGAAAAVLLLALHVAAARASRRADDLEPW